MSWVPIFLMQQTINNSMRGLPVAYYGRSSWEPKVPKRTEKQRRELVLQRATDAFNDQPRGFCQPKPLPLEHFIDHYDKEIHP